LPKKAFYYDNRRASLQLASDRSDTFNVILTVKQSKGTHQNKKYAKQQLE